MLTENRFELPVASCQRRKIQRTSPSASTGNWQLATGNWQLLMIKALIFDFNGVLVDDESVHFELFREVLEQEGVVITERDYHERYLGYDDRGCFAAALGDAKQAFDEKRLDDLIARKA